MNKRARNRLIGVTVMIVVIAGAIMLSMSGSGAYQKTVAQVVEDETLVGKRVKVAGLVVPGSVSDSTNPLKFDIESETEDEEGILSVSYKGTIPNTFGDGMKVVVTGPLESGGKLSAEDMMVVCPTKYESKTAATIPALLSQKQQRVGILLEVTGFAGAAVDGGFELQENADGGKSIKVLYAGEAPAGGEEIVVTGRLQSSGDFEATNVK